MKKSCILAAAFFSFFVFCTTDNSTNPTTAKGEYTDSIVVDLYAYSIWYMQNNPNYYGPVTITQKGQNLLKTPLDANLKSYNSGPMIFPVFTPKYPPHKFEAFIYDSVPLIDCDSLNPELLIKSASNSRIYLYCLDTASVSDQVTNIDKCISRPDIIYLYGFGFCIGTVDNYLKWGLGKVKIYYN